jgi:ribose transport system substrate-binding protein
MKSIFGFIFRLRDSAWALCPQLLAGVMLLSFLSCRRPAPLTIAVIPRTSGIMVWESAHRGAMAAAVNLGARIYWTAPTREDDVDGQIALVERVAAGGYQGLVLAPDQALALITPVRRAMQSGLPIVVIGSPLPIPPGNRLSYILNDEEGAGRIAARRVATLLHGRGQVAILGIDPDVSGIVTRAESCEEYLAANYPEIQVVQKRRGSFNQPLEQQVAEETLKANPNLNAIVALMSTSANGAITAIDGGMKSGAVKVIAFDPEGIDFPSATLDSFVLQNTHAMGEQSVRLIHAELEGHAVPAVTKLKPMLVTRENIHTPEVQEWMSMDWRPASQHWDWSRTP